MMKNEKQLKYLQHYSAQTQKQVLQLIETKKLTQYFLNKYPTAHTITSDKALFDYVSDVKQCYMKKSAPLFKVFYDAKISVIDNALGTHCYISRVQGSKLKAKNEIKIASLFKKVPAQFLEMIVVHELAHFKEKEHNKAFYKLCVHMQPQYHQYEFDMRLYLTHIDLYGKIY